MKEILLYSGGMDSYIAWHYLGQPDTLYVDLHHVYCLKETRAIFDTIPSTKIVACDLGQYEKPDADIPMRNLFLSMFAAEEGAEKVWLIVQRDEMSIPDRSEWFLKEASDMLSKLMEKSIVIDSPFRDMDKTDMVDWYVKEEGDVGSLLLTVGCFNGESGHCGNCGACFRRYVALSNNGINPRYELKDTIKKYYRDRFETYSKLRQIRMQPWLV